MRALHDHPEKEALDQSKKTDEVLVRLRRTIEKAVRTEGKK